MPNVQCFPGCEAQEPIVLAAPPCVRCADPEPTTQAMQVISPRNGDTVTSVHSIVGVGATPGATVELWRTIAGIPDASMASTLAKADGSWGFTGDTPVDPGTDLTWYVKSDGRESNHVSIHVEDAPKA